MEQHLPHSRLVKGENFSLLRPVTSIWILKEGLFPEINKCHLPFVPWNEEHGIMLSSHFAIHVLQLPEWQMSSSGHLEKDRWNVDIENPPEILKTKEMRQVMGILKDFSENQKNYLLYQERLEAEYLRNTLTAGIEREREEKEKAWKTVKKTQKEKEIAVKKAQKEKEMAVKKAQKEKERLLLLLKEAGIDPDQTVH